MKDHVRLCFECKSPNHIAANCPYKNDNEEDEKKKKKKKKKKKDKKEKKEKKMTFRKKKKESGYVVTWDSDCANDNDDDDDSSDDDKRCIKKALASIAIHNKPSLFDTPLTCLMAKLTKVKYDESDDEYESDDCKSDEEEDYSKDELIEICEQLSTG
jgi:hypothetical protein